MDRQLRVRIPVMDIIEAEQRPRESYGDVIERVMEELSRYRRYLQLHPELQIVKTVPTRGKHA
jgi:hypothetical protein